MHDVSKTFVFKERLKFAANQRTIDKLESAKVPRLASFLGFPTLRSAEMVTSSLHSEQREWSGIHLLLRLFYDSCLLLSPDSALLLVTADQVESGDENGCGTSTA